MKLNVITEVILRTSEEICLDIIAEHNFSKRTVLILKPETDIDFKLCDYFIARERGHCHISWSSFIIHSEFRRLETVSIMCLNACYILRMALCQFCTYTALVYPTSPPSPPWREYLSTFIKHSHVSSSGSVHKSELQWAVILVNDRHEVEKEPAHPPKRTHKVSQFPGDQLFAEDRRNGASYRKGWWCDMQGGLAKDEAKGEK
jgi:hypothetical protein